MPEANDSSVMEAPARRRFVVDRRTWLRGRGSGKSSLLSYDGERCCIGFVSSQCGISDADIRNVGTVVVLAERDVHVPAPLAGDHEGTARWIGQAYIINDDRDIDDADREARLVALFSANGLDLVFEN